MANHPHQRQHRADDRHDIDDDGAGDHAKHPFQDVGLGFRNIPLDVAPERRDLLLQVASDSPDLLLQVALSSAICC